MAHKIILTRRNKPDLECKVEHGKDVWRNGEQRGEGECTEVAGEVQIVLSRPWQMNTVWPCTPYWLPWDGRVNCLNLPLQNWHLGQKTIPINYYCILKKKSIISTEIANDKTQIAYNVTAKRKESRLGWCSVPCYQLHSSIIKYSISNYTWNPKMSYSLKATAHKLRPILLLKFSVQLLFAIPSQKRDKKTFLGNIWNRS